MSVPRSLLLRLQGFFAIMGLDVRRYYPPAWEPFQEFKRLLATISEFTLVSPDRCFALYQFARYAAHLDGSLAEVGVYRGGTAKLLASCAPNKTIHIFDTFAGIPHADYSVDSHIQGDFADTSEEYVRRVLSDCPNVAFHRGTFPEPSGAVKDEMFCFVHVDVDVYASTRDCLAFFYPRLTNGGVIVVDDFQWERCKGVTQAVHEFLDTSTAAMIVAARHQCALLKPPVSKYDSQDCKSRSLIQAIL